MGRVTERDVEGGEAAAALRFLFGRKAKGPRLDQMAPAFRLARVRGGHWELSRALRRRRVALVFNHGGGCGRCTQLLADLSESYAALRDQNTDVVAVSNEATRQGQRLIDRFALRFPLLIDPHNSVTAQYDLLQDRRGFSMWLSGRRIDVQPTVVLVDRDGSVGWCGRAHHRRAQLDADHVVAAAAAVRARQRGGPDLELVCDLPGDGDPRPSLRRSS